MVSEDIRMILDTAKLLYAQCVGCVIQHHRLDFYEHGLPGWLADCEKEIIAAEASLSASTESVVKPLEWVNLSSGQVASTPFGGYQVRGAIMTTRTNRPFELMMPKGEYPISTHATEDAAKAAAQADYERRVLSALIIPASSAVPKTEAVDGHDDLTQVAIHLDCEPDLDSVLHTIREIQADLDIAKDKILVAQTEAVKPIAHLVWLQAYNGIDDVHDYYEVARLGDKCVDGSDPFPVYATPPTEPALIAELQAKVERMAEALNARNKTISSVLTWAEQRCPCTNEEPNPCPLCLADANNPKDICLSAENTLPRFLLSELRQVAALSDGRQR